MFVHTDGTTEAFYGGFASSSAAWQYVNRAVVAKKDYTSIRASFVYDKHVGTASFDGLSVFKDEYWPSYTYDDKGELISCKDAKNKATEFEHNAGGDMTGFKTPSGAEFSYEYNGRHRVTAATSAVGKKYTFAYDSYGNITRQKLTDPQDAGKNILSRCVYENGKYPKEIYDPFGKCVRYDYNNASGELRSVTDVNGSVTSYTYDVLGRLVKTEKKDASQQKIGEVSYTYEKDRIKTITKDGLEYRFGYDSLGHMNHVKVGGMSVAQHTYDPQRFGLLTQTTFGNGQGVGYVYDDQDRVIKKTGISGNSTVDEYTFAYDMEGNLACVKDLVNHETLRYQYSSAGELARILWEGGTDFTYDYDTDGSLESITAEDGKKMSYTYNSDFAETRTMTLEGKKLRTDYDGLGRVVKKQLIDGMTPRYDTEFTYRATGQSDGTCSNVVESILYKKVQDGTSTEEERLTYSYYDDGNIRKIDHTKNGTTVSTDYVYDALGQLLRVNDPVEGKTRIYTYNAGFNMTSEKVYAYTTEAVPSGSCTERTFTYENGWKDQLDYIQINNDEEIELTHDGAGNLTGYNGNSYTWKNGRQLAGITKNDGTQISYSYDHNGMRVKKIVGSTVHSYRYCGSLLMEEKTGSTTMRLSYDSLGNAVSILYNGTEYYYMRNLQGDVIGLMNKNGEWVVRYRYDVWGNVLEVSGVRASTVGQDNPIRYRGYYYDAETGFYYVSSRYYDPEVGRFINADSQLNMKDGFVGFNMFAYCNNNPVMYSDPTGHSIMLACIIGGAILGAIAGGFTAAKVSKAKTGEVNKKAVVAAAVGGAVIGGLAGWGFGTVANAIGAAVASKAAAAASSTAPVVNKAIESVSTAIQPYYPPNDGFAGIPQKITLEVGTMLQRTGSLYGSFVAPAGTPSQMLALPYDKIGQVPVYLQVQQPLQVLAGKVAPWFGQMGGGTQYVLNSSVQQLITDGVLRLME